MKTDLVLEAIATNEGIEAGKEEVEEELALLAQGFAGDEGDEEEIKQQLREQGYDKYLASTIVRSKTLNFLAAENLAQLE